MPTPADPRSSLDRSRSQAFQDALNQKQITRKAESTTPSFTTERDTPHTHEQTLERSSTYLTNSGISPCVQTEASKGLQPQRSPNNSLATIRSDRMGRELLGIGAQFDGIDIMHHRRGITQSDPVPTCPLHGRVLRKNTQDHRSGQGLGPMDRYLAEGSSDRCSMLQQRYHEGSNARQDCRCTKMKQRDSRVRKQEVKSDEPQ